MFRFPAVHDDLVSCLVLESLSCSAQGSRKHKVTTVARRERPVLEPPLDRGSNAVGKRHARHFRKLISVRSDGMQLVGVAELDCCDLREVYTYALCR